MGEMNSVDRNLGIYISVIGWGRNNKQILEEEKEEITERDWPPTRWHNSRLIASELDLGGEWWSSV